MQVDHIGSLTIYIPLPLTEQQSRLVNDLNAVYSLYALARHNIHSIYRYHQTLDRTAKRDNRKVKHPTVTKVTHPVKVEQAYGSMGNARIV